MTSIEIPFVAEGDNLNFEITVNGVAISHTVVDNKIVADANIFGLATLCIKTLTSTKVKFENVFLDRVNIRQFLFLSWSELNGQKLQPCTELWEPEQVWYIPISNPMSLLISVATDKFQGGDLGNNLFEKYDIFYPESVEVSNYYPKLIKDFFKYNFDFYARKKVDKNDLFLHNGIPYFKFDFQYNKQDLYKEILDNQDYLATKEIPKPYQIEYNKIDSENTFDEAMAWRTVTVYNKNKVSSVDQFELDKTRFPKLLNFYKSLPIENIYYSFIGILPQNGYIAPHKDWLINVPKGCSQLYFPLNPSSDHYFKLNGVGLLPMDCYPLVINNQDYTHCVVNQTDTVRYAIGLFADIKGDLIEYIV